MNFNFKNYSIPYQINLNFLDYNWVMSGIITLHHDILVYLILIIIAISYIIVRIYISFVPHNQSVWSHTISTPSHIFFNKKMLNQNKKYYNNEIVLEIIWTVVPMLILIFIGLLTMSFIYNLCNYVYLPNYTIGVTGHQWYWDYSYNDYNLILESFLIHEDYLLQGELRLLEVDNRLIIPSQSHIRIFVTSDDVVHSWAVPSLGIKIDANPGRMNHCHLFVNNYIGTFYGQCSELCGTGHSLMPISIQAIPNWLFKLIINSETNLTLLKSTDSIVNSVDSTILASIDESTKKKTVMIDKEIIDNLLITNLECIKLNEAIDAIMADIEETLTSPSKKEDLHNFLNIYFENIFSNDVDNFIKLTEEATHGIEIHSRRIEAVVNYNSVGEIAARVPDITIKDRNLHTVMHPEHSVYDMWMNLETVPPYMYDLLYKEINLYAEKTADLSRILYEHGFTPEQVQRCEYQNIYSINSPYKKSWFHNPYSGWTEIRDSRYNTHINMYRARVIYINEVLPKIYGNLMGNNDIEHLNKKYLSSSFFRPEKIDGWRTTTHLLIAFFSTCVLFLYFYWCDYK